MGATKGPVRLPALKKVVRPDVEMMVTNGGGRAASDVRAGWVALSL